MRYESIISIQDGTIVDAQEKKRVFRGTTLLRGEASSKLPRLQEVENLFAKMKKAGITMPQSMDAEAIAAAAVTEV